MWRRYLISLLMACVALLLLGSFPGEGAAQDVTSSYAVGPPAGLDDVAMLFKNTPVPVRLYEVRGPDSLQVGEEGHFTALANVEAASLPLRLQWDFGDDATANSLHARHRFTSPGTYPVTFSLSNRYGEATDTLVVTVVPSWEVAPTAPRASLSEHAGRKDIAKGY